jgi:hypothetical protein
MRGGGGAKYRNTTATTEIALSLPVGQTVKPVVEEEFWGSELLWTLFVFSSHIHDIWIT